jgi:wyosine [tRNA(Phe)-imidazoG37] synthetase (radical SAM superfamily)
MLVDRFRIDSHKLIYHPWRVSEWLAGKLIYPIYIEIATSGACNHRCIFCALDYVGYKMRFLDRDVLARALVEMGQRGVKSVMFSGEGEPLLHKQMGQIVADARGAGLDVAITTNATPLTERLSSQILGAITWIKVSINAGSRDTYAFIHRTRPQDFDRVLRNLRGAIRIKRQNNYPCTIGVQMILLPENSHEAVMLAKITRDLGADYIVIKPYSQHPMSLTRRYERISYSQYLDLADQLEQLSGQGFEVLFRKHTMLKWDQDHRYYRICYALPFWAYIDAAGNLWGCSAWFGDEGFLYGNIYKESFSGIWEGERRRASLKMVQAMDITRCRRNCRMDEINRYLWDLKNPPEHVNFI